MDITLLGTGAANPTEERGVSAIYVKSAQTKILLDCGEGTLRQMALMSTSPTVDAICLTHEHTDHIGGLVGIIRAISLTNRTTPLPIYATPGTIAKVRQIIEAYHEDISFTIAWTPLSAGQVWSIGSVAMSAFPTSHLCDSMGFRLTAQAPKRGMDIARCKELGVPAGPMMGRLQKGESIVLTNGQTVSPDDVLLPAEEGVSLAYTGDTMPCQSVVEGVRGVDLLITDSTYLEQDITLSIKNAHSTAAEAAQTAQEAEVKELVLTHISAKYKTEQLPEFQAQATEKFQGKVSLAQDGQKFTLQHTRVVERGR